MKSSHEISQYIAEFLGTFFMVFFGCGAMVLAEVDTGFASALIPFAFGASVAAMIYATGHISGAHFNPAVTLSFWVTKRLPTKRVLGYVFAQCLGALAASFAHGLIFGFDHSFGATFIHTTLVGGIIVEFLLSFVLMFVILSVATDARAVGEMAGLAIGLTVALCAAVGGPLTNASMNPARSIGPAILSSNYSNLWLYILIPIVGAVLGAKTYEWIRCQKESQDDSHGCC
ncbi:MAG: aquaporin [Halobacteriovorax sp.]|nr:aquaporin [Halobacteriovorax sp.]